MLPAYVTRDHDCLVNDAVMAALGGLSRLVVLVGGSSTGKTPPCWESLSPLRASGQD